MYEFSLAMLYEELYDFTPLSSLDLCVFFFSCSVSFVSILFLLFFCFWVHCERQGYASEGERMLLCVGPKGGWLHIYYRDGFVYIKNSVRASLIVNNKFYHIFFSKYCVSVCNPVIISA